LSDEGPFGEIIGILSKRDADLWDGMEEIYTSRDPNEATGTSLDNVAAETGVRRIDATSTETKNVLLYGDEGTSVATGKQIRQENNDLTHSLDVAVTITKAAALKLKLEPDTPSGGGGEYYSITLDSVLYDYTAIGGDTKGDVIDALVADIVGGSFVGTPSNEDDEFLVIDGDDSDGDNIPDTSFNASAWTGTLTLEALASGGDFTADETGPNPVPANTLIVIVTPVANWDSVNNPGAGVTGRDVETDVQLRLRRASTILAGNATDEAIRGALLNEVTGVTSASVTSNRKLEGQTQRVIFDDDFVTGNLITFSVNGFPVTPVPFNTDQATTMDDIKTQIEADVSNTSVTIFPDDPDTRTLLITYTGNLIIIVTVSVTGGASQTMYEICYSDTEGRPRKSFEAVVQGGSDEDVALEIWQTQPSGIESFGNTTEVVTDSEGNPQTILFSRPSPWYIHVKVKRNFYNEEDYPTDGDQAIKDNIVDWALINQAPDVDVIRQRLNIPIYEVPGIRDIEVTLDGTPNPGDSPAYAEQNILISARQIADFDQSRIVVELLT
jgi:uncharacterized phage protein gp47/JayE